MIASLALKISLAMQAAGIARAGKRALDAPWAASAQQRFLGPNARWKALAIGAVAVAAGFLLHLTAPPALWLLCYKVVPPYMGLGFLHGMAAPGLHAIVLPGGVLALFGAWKIRRAVLREDFVGWARDEGVAPADAAAATVGWLLPAALVAICWSPFAQSLSALFTHGGEPPPSVIESPAQFAGELVAQMALSFGSFLVLLLLVAQARRPSQAVGRVLQACLFLWVFLFVYGMVFGQLLWLVGRWLPEGGGALADGVVKSIFFAGAGVAAWSQLDGRLQRRWAATDEPPPPAEAPAPPTLPPPQLSRDEPQPVRRRGEFPPPPPPPPRG